MNFIYKSAAYRYLSVLLLVNSFSLVGPYCQIKSELLHFEESGLTLIEAA